MIFLIKHVKQGIANNYDGVIEIHEDLFNHPKLYDMVLRHELKHGDKNTNSFKDFLLDLKPSGVSFFKMWGWVIKHPSSWVQVLPLWKHKTRGWVFDLNLTIKYAIILILLIANILLWGFLEML